MAQLDRWEKLKAWLRTRHDYLENQYKTTGYSADASEMGTYRTIYQVMRDIEATESTPKPNPGPGVRP